MIKLTVIILIAFLISSAWLHYLRKIDLFEKEKLLRVVITFILGVAVPYSIFPLHHYVFGPLRLEENGHYVHDFLFDVFAVGAVEEIIKFVPVGLVLLLTKKTWINEPVDYVKYMLVSALGFAFTENLEYCLTFGVDVLINRSILAVPAHMFFSALFIYGIVLYKYQRIKYGPLVIPAYMLLAFIAHGFYDFSLDLGNSSLGILITVMYFFVLMSLFITILNNGLNNSPFFDPKYVIDTDRLRNQVCLFYAGIIVCTLLAKAFFMTWEDAGKLLLQFVLTRFFILAILIIRLCRFKLIQHRWNQLKLELPFYFQRRPSFMSGGFPFTLRVKGDSFNEVYINSFYHEHFKLAPLRNVNSVLRFTRDAYIESKFFLKNDEAFFVAKITVSAAEERYAHFLLKAKTRGLTRNANNEPIAALLSIADPEVMADKSADTTDLKFVEWVVLKKNIGARAPHS